jgi:hypothetical protein
MKIISLNCQVCHAKGTSTQYHKSKKTVDISGAVWENGDTCPTCVLKYSKPLYTPTKERKCRGCSKVLPANRWWHCDKCRELTEDENFGVDFAGAKHNWLHRGF